jgi:hypothetical protein
MLKQDLADWDMARPAIGLARLGHFLSLVMAVVGLACFVAVVVIMGPNS